MVEEKTLVQYSAEIVEDIIQHLERIVKKLDKDSQNENLLTVKNPNLAISFFQTIYFKLLDSWLSEQVYEKNLKTYIDLSLELEKARQAFEPKQPKPEGEKE
jgi:hypothetical protein